MKNILTIFVCILLFSGFTLAQKMNVHTSGGVTGYNLTDIDSITFSMSSVLGDLHDPVLEVQFDEHPYNHNMHITSDGSYYYTINGGSASVGQINKFTLAGTLVQTYPIQIDGRGLTYNSTDGFLYASLYGGNIVKINSLENGTWDVVHSDIMQNEQASFDLSPDGTKLYDFYNGTLEIHNFQTGALETTITGLSNGSGSQGGDAAVAVDGEYIYTWDSSIKTVYVYTNSGSFVRSMVLSDGNYGFSLSFVDGYIFVSNDGNYNIGTWYGYNIRRALSGEMISNKIEFAISTADKNTFDDSTK
jgi:hypothetical protein